MAANGEEAVRLATDGGFDLVLMDGHMPVMDGIEATRRIRRLEPPAGNVPVVALSASVTPSERATSAVERRRSTCASTWLQARN